jgi:uncharacterized protein YbjT (DUF2867 family)
VTEPLLIHHGTADESCPIVWSERTAAAFEKAGKDVELVKYKGEHHTFAPRWPALMDTTMDSAVGGHPMAERLLGPSSTVCTVPPESGGIGIPSDRPRRKGRVMKFAVIGGTGLIGSQVVTELNAAGHDAVPHSQSTGVDVLTGKGLEQAVEGADTVINLTNSPTFDEASPAFFQTSMDNLLAAARKSDVQHFVILSIVGVDQVPELDYYRAKALQEDVLRAGPVPYSIVRATQFMEFVDAVLSWTTDGDTVRLPSTPIQPIAAKDVAATVAEVAAGTPLGGIHNVAGPDVYRLDELGRITLDAHPDGRTVTTDDSAGMFAAVRGAVLIAPKDAHIAPTRYTDWLS